MFASAQNRIPITSVQESREAQRKVIHSNEAPLFSKLTRSALGRIAVAHALAAYLCGMSTFIVCVINGRVSFANVVLGSLLYLVMSVCFHTVWRRLFLSSDNHHDCFRARRRT